MIWGIGHDIVENVRIEELLEQFGNRGMRRILTAAELEICQTHRDPSKFVAKRFAAKEAFAKACGTGLRAPVLLSNISVLNDEFGKPYFVFAPALVEFVNKLGIKNCHLSLSDEKSLSSAVVILEK